MACVFFVVEKHNYEDANFKKSCNQVERENTNTKRPESPRRVSK